MQVTEKPALLNLMLRDLREAPQEYRPTNYWEYHEKHFLPELQKLGLRDFRRRKNSVLSSFGATDLDPLQVDFASSLAFNNPITRALPFQDSVLRALNSLAHLRPLSPATVRHLKRLVPVQTNYYYDVSPEDLRQISYDFVRAEAEKTGARPIEALEISLAGNPEDVFEMGGRPFTMSTFFYYLHYVYAHRFIDFDAVKLYVELGPGMGKQVEVLRKLHPAMSFMLFDIPPQLYVAECYLSTVFPGDVISYEQTRNLTALPAIQPGKIHLFGSWKFPLLEGAAIDLFWNAASFQEMEPDVVANYLRPINASANNVFLHEFMEGKEIARKKGDTGVLEPTTLEHYRAALSRFDLLDLSPSRKPAGQVLAHHSDSFWRRRDR